MPSANAVLLIYYGHIRNEVTRYRNLEWQITAYVTGVLAFLFSLIGTGNVIDTTSGWPIKALWTGLVGAIGLFGEFALTYVHRTLNRSRDDMVRLEVWLGLYSPVRPDQRLMDSGLFSTAEVQSVIVRVPRRYHGFNEGRGIVFVLSFMAFVGLFCTISILRLWLA